MSITGAVNVHPSAYPLTRVRSSSGTAPTHHGSALGSCSTSVPGTIRTPVSSSSASASKAAYDAADQAVTRSCGQRPVRVPERSRDRRRRLQRQVAGEHVDPVPGLEQPDGAGQPDHPGTDHDHPPACARAWGRVDSPPVRLVVARCQVDYAGRLTAHLPMATRVLMLKADGSVLVHSDGGSYKPLNWMCPPCTVREGTTEDGRVEWTVTAKTDDTLRILIEEVLHDSSHDLGVDPGPAEGRRREAPAGAARRAPRDARRRASPSSAASSRPPSARST